MSMSEYMKKKKIAPDIITRHLLNETDINENQMINKLINDDELSRREFEKYFEVWEKSANVKDFEKIDTEDDWSKVRTKLNFSQTSKRIPLQSFLLRIAAVFLLAFGLTYFYTHYLKTVKTVALEYYETTSLNIKKEIRLTDGTIIFLNKNSKIIQNSDYGKTNRDIILVGEAFFDVAKNPALHFKVHTLNSTVEVLGTSFNIKCDSQKVVVGVVRGKVAFYQTGNLKNRIELIPDNTGIYDVNNNNLITEEYLNPNSIAWRTGKLIFKKTPDNDVFKTIAEYFDKKLVIQPGAPLDITFTGEFDKQSLNEMIEIFNLSRPSKYKVDVITTDNSIIVKKL
jgi:transmembrane sensor